MKFIYRKFLHGLSTFLVVLSAAPFAQADDTEIFFGNPSGNGVIPNVLFILDNSGSMATNITTQSVFDPTVNYSGGISDTWIYVYEGGSYRGAIKKSSTHCQTMLDKLGVSGQYTSAKVASYYNKKWRNVLYSSTSDANPTECKDDRGVHGSSASSSDKYARKGTNKSMWTSQTNKEVGWNGFKTYHYYSANYLNWYFYHRVATSQSRLDIMKGVINNLVDSTSGINIGLMSFNTNNGGKQGGRVQVPIDYIENNRSNFKTNMNALSPQTWTPLAETLFEGMRYYEGGEVFLGSQSVSGSKDPSNSSKYQSPIVSECQPNNIVLLTDGEPTFDAYQSGGNYDSNDGVSRDVIESKVGNCSGNCLEEVAKYMYENDLRSDLVDPQNVKTYTIGFNIDHKFLKETAEGDSSAADNGGGGQYFTANDTDELDSALKSILTEIKAVNASFVTPGVAVNSFNRLNHRSELYFSLFRPDLRPEWSGNLKRYSLGSDGVIYDSVGNSAVDKTTGFFADSSKSWWSNSKDGADVSIGGAADNLPSTNADRRVFTYLTGGPLDLTAASNSISVANKAKISKSLLNIPSASDAEHESLISWIRGADAKDEDSDGDKTESRNVIMDPLHSSPAVVIYGGTDANPDTTIFFGDNQGFLHAINGKSGSGSGYGNSEGEEYFSFIPEDLLQNQKTLFDNSQASPHPYGMDGAITAWGYNSNPTQDGNSPDLTDPGDFVYVYSGMRRGGNNYYAIDATKRTAPKMLWQIKGGSSGMTGFEELGQTWSRPLLTKVKVNNTTKDALIFAGGYDTNQDSATTRSVDTIGRAIYIVDAKTGSIIWSGGNPSSASSFNKTFADMKYSIPSNIRAIDINGDSLADQLYVGDMGGQIWRFDINNGQPTSKLVDGAVIADLADNTTAGNRRFYHEPDVSVINDGGTRKVSIAIGSGWQSHPLSTDVENRFYLLKTPDLMEKPGDNNNDGKPDYVFYTESDMYDATDNHLGHVSSSNTLVQQVQAYLDLGNKPGGWFIKLTRPGEKVLASALTFNGEIFFTTYEPVPNNSGCSVSAGTPRLFHIYQKNASPVKNYDGLGSDTELTIPDREVKLLTTSIPTSPQRLRIDGKNILVNSMETIILDDFDPIIRTYWAEEE